MPIENVVQIDQKNMKMPKNRGEGRNQPPPSSTSLKYLRNERADQRFHLLISKFVTFWSWSQSQSLHKKQWLWLNKTVKIHVFFNPNRHEGGGGIRPPSSFFELYQKVLEVET